VNALVIRKIKDITISVAIVSGSFVMERIAESKGAVKYATITAIAAGGTAKITNIVKKTGSHFIISLLKVSCFSLLNGIVHPFVIIEKINLGIFIHKVVKVDYNRKCKRF